MQLNSRIKGSGPPLIILHGLFGMSDNWITIGNELAASGFTVHLLDLRNHGQSPHAVTHRYTDMCEDLLIYLEQQHIEKAILIGHSMGGKLGMVFSLLEPDRVDKLVVVDMAPSDYRDPRNNYHAEIIDTLYKIDLPSHTSRGTIKKELIEKLDDQPLATFLAKNITRDKNSKKFIWKLNLPVLRQYLNHIHIGLEELSLYAPCPVTTLFIKGNDSNYYRDEHEPDRHYFFPDSELVGIDNGGHWLHSDQPKDFLQVVTDFLVR